MVSKQSKPKKARKTIFGKRVQEIFCSPCDQVTFDTDVTKPEITPKKARQTAFATICKCRLIGPGGDRKLKGTFSVSVLGKLRDPKSVIKKTPLRSELPLREEEI